MKKKETGPEVKGTEAPKLPRRYEIHYLDDKKKKVYKVFVLDELFQFQFDEINSFLDELKIKDNWNISGGDVLEINFRISKAEFYPNILAIVLRDEKGEAYTPEFYSKCVAKDLQEPINDFFVGEGAFIMSGISSTMLSLLLSKKQEANLQS